MTTIAEQVNRRLLEAANADVADLQRRVATLETKIEETLARVLSDEGVPLPLLAGLGELWGSEVMTQIAQASGRDWNGIVELAAHEANAEVES